MLLYKYLVTSWFAVRTGACLFHAIALTQDEDAARQLRHAVVNFVAENWDANPVQIHTILFNVERHCIMLQDLKSCFNVSQDISAIMGAERRAIQPTISLQEEFCRQCVAMTLRWGGVSRQVHRSSSAALIRMSTCRYGDATIRSGDDYRSLMERDGTYGEQSEAAVAAMLLGVELTIYASAAPPGMEPAPQNLYREASGLGK